MWKTANNVTLSTIQRIIRVKNLVRDSAVSLITENNCCNVKKILSLILPLFRISFCFFSLIIFEINLI